MSTDGTPSESKPTSGPSSSPNLAASGSTLSVPKQKSGVRAALEYTGIPPSLFEKRPKLPSRNWLIFLSVVGASVGMYVYDRRECRKIREEYVRRVSHLAEVPLHSMDLPRKVTVYGAKWPGDEDHDRNMRYFRKYVKPVLHAAAVDYDMVVGKRTGEIAELVADQTKSKRRIAAGLDQEPQSGVPTPVKFTPEEKRRRELDGGVVIVGRGTLKEFLHGLKRGWTDGLDKFDKESQLAHELELDGVFDEPEDGLLSPSGLGVDGEPIPTLSRLPSATNTPMPIFSPLQAQIQSMNKPQPVETKGGRPDSRSSAVPSHLNAPPAFIPRLPPLLLVQHTNHIGLSQIPIMIWDWFNERHRVRAGAEAGFRLVMGYTRPFVGPTTNTASDEGLIDPATMIGSSTNTPSVTRSETDLDFDRLGESYYKSSLNKWPEEIEKARKDYYAALPKKLETARALARRTREPTSEEQSHPPPTENDLRQERMRKEQRWRADVRGWDIIKPSAEVAWDERFRDALSAYVDPPEMEEGPSQVKV